jgi:hypothetical protein
LTLRTMSSCMLNASHLFTAEVLAHGHDGCRTRIQPLAPCWRCCTP